MEGTDNNAENRPSYSKEKAAEIFIKSTISFCRIADLAFFPVTRCRKLGFGLHYDFVRDCCILTSLEAFTLEPCAIRT